MRSSLFLKVSMLLVALAGVLYGIKTLRSPSVQKEMMDPGNALAVLIGSDQRPSNWCPPGTSRVELISADASKATLETPAEISAVCEIMMGAVNESDIPENGFEQRLIAHGEAGKIVILEQVPGKAVFRVQGLSFASPMLSKALTKLGGKP